MQQEQIPDDLKTLFNQQVRSTQGNYIRCFIIKEKVTDA